MDAYRTVKEDLQKLISKTLKLGIIVNPKVGGGFYSNANKISSHYTFFRDEYDYLENYASAYENGKYIFALNDGSFFQLNYEFFRKTKNKIYLQKMNLCYLPKIENEYITNSYVRVDYDVNEKPASFIHTKAHMHIGFENSSRIPLDEVLLFSEFFEFICYCFYPDDYKKYFGIKYPKTITHNSQEGKLTQKSVLANELLEHTYIKTKKRTV